MAKVLHCGSRGFAFFMFKFACLLKVSIKISGHRSYFSTYSFLYTDQINLFEKQETELCV